MKASIVECVDWLRYRDIMENNQFDMKIRVSLIHFCSIREIGLGWWSVLRRCVCVFRIL